MCLYANGIKQLSVMLMLHKKGAWLSLCYCLGGFFRAVMGRVARQVGLITYCKLNWYAYIAVLAVIVPDTRASDCRPGQAC
jgi:hypothetical protein